MEEHENAPLEEGGAAEQALVGQLVNSLQR